MSVEKISEHRARYKYLFVNKLSDEKSGLNPLGNCFLYCPLSHSKLNIILFTNYIVIHCRQCGGEWRGLCLFVYFIFFLLCIIVGFFSKMIFLLALMKALIFIPIKRNVTLLFIYLVIWCFLSNEVCSVWSLSGPFTVCVDNIVL